jgi:hypothetical protein
MNILYWNVTDWMFCTGISLLYKWIFCTGMSLLTGYFVLECPYWLDILYWNVLTDWIFCTGISLQMNILYWNIPPKWIFCTGMVLTGYFVLAYPYWLDISYRNVLTDWIFCTGMSLLTGYFALECPYWLLVWHRAPPSKSVMLKYDLLSVFQKQRFRFDTNSKCQYDNEGPPSKTVILMMTWFWYSKIKLYMTPAVRVITVRLRLYILY